MNASHLSCMIKKGFGLITWLQPLKIGSAAAMLFYGPPS
jgi:hypothetical protein